MHFIYIFAGDVYCLVLCLNSKSRFGCEVSEVKFVVLKSQGTAVHCSGESYGTGSMNVNVVIV